MGQQACRRNALVDDLRRHRRLHQRFALPTDPFAADVAFHRKDAGLVVELLRHVLADALQLAAASARRGIRIVGYFLAWQRGRQRGAPGLLLTIVLGRFGRRELLDLGGQGFDVSIEGLKQHALLLAAIGFAGGSELEPLEDGHLVRELVDQRLLATHLFHQPAGEVTQFIGVEGGQVGCRSHARPCARATAISKQKQYTCAALDHGNGVISRRRLPWQAGDQCLQLLDVEGHTTVDAPSVQTKQPRLRRRAARQIPKPSYTRTFIRVPLLLANR